MPSEEEQFQAYHHVATVLHPQPVIIRTLDLGGDKVLPSQDGQRESNPFRRNGENGPFLPTKTVA